MSQGAASVIWFDTYNELRAMVGGSGGSSLNTAVGRGRDTGGVFVWTDDTTTADDGGIVIVPSAVMRTGCWKRIVNGVINVAWFGAFGDGTDHSAEIRSAIAAAGSPATIYFPAGTYVVSPENVGVDDWCIRLTSNNLTLQGAGRDATVLKLGAVPDPWPQILSVRSASGITIRSLTIDGNKTVQTSCGACEHQFGLFIKDCTDVVVEDVHIRDTMGDLLYLYGECQRVTISRSSFSGSNRAGIHAQSFKEVVIKDCQFRDCAEFGHIYQELDCENGVCSTPGHRISVIGCHFVASSSSFNGRGIFFAGASEASISSGFVISGNTFRGLPQAIVVHRFSVGYSITGNTIVDCGQGISGWTYSVVPRYAGCEHVAAVGNVLRNVGGPSTPPIHIYNTTCSVIGGNVVSGPDSSAGIDVTHSKRVAVSGNAVTVGDIDGSNGAICVRLYRDQECAVTRNVLTMPDSESAKGVLLDDDDMYPMNRAFIAANQITGNAGTAVHFDIWVKGRAQSAVVRNSVSPGVIPFGERTEEQEDFPTFEREALSGMKCTHGTAAPGAGTWAVGDRVVNTSPSAGGYLGWVCVSAGTPGTWKGFDAIDS